MTTLRGIFPSPKPPRRKNFIQENVKNLRRMEQYFQASKEVEDLEKLKNQSRQSKYQNVAARINSSLHRSSRLPKDGNESAEVREIVAKSNLERKSSAPELRNNTCSITPNRLTKNSSNNKTRLIVSAAVTGKEKAQESRNSRTKKRETLPKIPLNLSFTQDNNTDCDSNGEILKYTSRGIQTLDTDSLEGIYAEGIVRYSSARSAQTNGNDGHIGESIPIDESDKGDGPLVGMKKTKKDSSPCKENADCLKSNKDRASVASKMAVHLNNGVLPANYRKGVVPKYIKERKEERQQEKERKALEDAILAECPEGHVPLPDNERRETLSLLKKNYQQLVNELNMLPIRSDTLRSQRRKIEIERQLTKLEEGIKVFSRPKLFVKINA